MRKGQDLMEVGNMPHSHVCCPVHVVFATAQRRPMIREDLQEKLYGYIGGIARENGIPALAVGGAADRIHCLLSLPRTVSVAKAVQLLKSGSSKWVHDNFPRLKSFAWQEKSLRRSRKPIPAGFCTVT